ncbi:MAG: RNA polymerase factor sigma-54, partial [Planctomycetes bacterium]|nr:RNA polymerase factor sigma-54 [Planctomycetota bacterium]
GPTRVRRGASSGDKKLEAFQNTPSKSISLQDYLYHQFIMMEISDEVKKIGENIIYNIDNNGYLQVSLEEITQATETSSEQAAEVLELIRKLDPPGVGAGNLAECLLLQLQEGDPDLELKKNLINQHLENIKLNKIPLIAKELNRSIDEIKKAVQEITSLNPHPGADFSGEKVPHIMPDIIVRKIDGRYEVTLESGYIPNLAISSYYQGIAKDKASNPKVKEFVTQKILSARRLMTAIQLRQTTLYRIAKEIVTVQGGFLDEGIAHLKPLKMQKVADELDLHVSTISRAIAAKYIQTPRGIFSLKFFFSRAAETISGEVQTHNRVIELIKKMITREDKKSPMSDEAIVEELKKEGVTVARRTAAKYRKLLKIPSSVRRKEY